MQPPPVGATIAVKSFRFAGNTLLKSEQLTLAVTEFVDRPLAFNQLQGAVVAVANAYREAGWVVRAYLPKQDITEGIVTIQIVEAVFGGAKLEGPDATRVKAEDVLAIFSAQQKTGDFLNSDAIDRALLLAGDLPGIAVNGSLRQGKAEREAEYVVNLADKPLASGDAALDNTGLRSMGREKLALNANLNSPLGFGDSLAGSAIHTQGSDYFRLGYTMPVRSDGWRIGFSASHLKYKLITSEFQGQNGKGLSDSTGLEASYPIIRSLLKNLNFAFNYDRKSFDNELLGPTTKYKVSLTTIGLNGNLIDNLGGGGSNSASLSLVNGNVDLNGSPNQAADAASAKTAGHYSKLKYSLSRQQILTNELALFASLSGQVASKNMDSSEKFFAGGSSGVRAYPTNEGGGSEGSLASLELRWRFYEGFTLTGFYDRAHVKVNRDNSITAAALNDYSMRGGGLGLAWQTSVGPTLKAVWARRIGDNPNPTATGNDQEGALIKNRFWLTASVPF